MAQDMLAYLRRELATLHQQGLYKEERIITSPQRADIDVEPNQHVINFCANNYLGLSDHPDLIASAKKAVETHGFGMSSVRFICGTQDIHKKLEAKISKFLQMDDAILYSSCFDANGGLFETLLSEEDAVISDELNHASIIDGVRLCKAKRFRYKNNNMRDLELKLQEADVAGARFKLIATDGVFSMDGIIANLKDICELADRYSAYVMVDDSHAVGFIGENGCGTPERCGVMDRVDIITGTLGKALGGASGGYTAARKEIVDWLRNRSRPYLFSNSVCPVIVGASLTVFELLESDAGKQLRERLHKNSAFFREHMTKLGFDLIPGEHPIIPVMLGDAKLAVEMSNALLKEGIYVIGFSYPVVPMGKARLRLQMSAAHERKHLEKAITAFEKVGKLLNVIQ